jgi:hypothetical protein
MPRFTLEVTLLGHGESAGLRRPLDWPALPRTGELVAAGVEPDADRPTPVESVTWDLERGEAVLSLGSVHLPAGVQLADYAASLRERGWSGAADRTE